MSPALILQVALASLPLIQVAVPQFIAWIEALRGAMLQSGEWTQDQESAFRASLMLKMQDQAYQPDPK